LSESQLEELKKKLTEEKELELKQQVAILLNFVCSYLTHRKISFECLSNGQRIVLVHSDVHFLNAVFEYVLNVSLILH
jgi:hypothetical protein